MKDTVADYQKNVQTWFWSLDIQYYSQVYIYYNSGTSRCDHLYSASKRFQGKSL